MDKKDYTKLPGRGRRAGTLISHCTCTLWLGEDHLLQIESEGGYTENYRRFYFRDIQALVIRKTQTATNWTVVHLFVVATFSLLAWSFREQPIAVGILGFLAAVSGIFLIWNAARGSTCICHVKTAVQTDQLPALRRLRDARKALAIVNPLIERAQGSLNPDELKHHLEESTPSPLSIHAGPAPLPIPSITRKQPRGETPYRGPVHLWFFCVLISTGAFDLVHIFYHPVGFVVFETLLSLSVIALAVWALVKQRGSDLNHSARLTTWISAIYLGLVVFVGYIETIAMTVANPESAGNQWDALKTFSEIEPLETPWLLAILVVNIFMATGLGVFGLLSLRKRRHETVSPTPSPIGTNPPPS